MADAYAHCAKLEVGVRVLVGGKTMNFYRTIIFIFGNQQYFSNSKNVLNNFFSNV